MCVCVYFTADSGCHKCTYIYIYICLLYTTGSSTPQASVEVPPRVTLLHSVIISVGIAMSVSDPPPGLRSARRFKRHQAVIRDFESIMSRFDALEAKLDTVMQIVSSEQDGHCDTNSSIGEAVTSVTTRVTRIEMLLMRTSMEDFKVLDEKLQGFLPTVLGVIGPKIRDLDEKHEQKQIPLNELDHASLSSTASYQASSCGAPDASTKVEWYDISDHTADASTQTADCTSFVSSSSGPCSNSAPWVFSALEIRRSTLMRLNMTAQRIRR